jgi:hypothetical protein
VTTGFGGMLPPMILASTALTDTIGLVVVFFVVFPVLAQGLIAFAVAQALGERRENRDYRGPRGQGPSRG